MKGLRTGEVARRAGVKTGTVLYYEKLGLIPAPPRSAAGYRQFPVETVRVVRFIKRAQNLGFSLREIRELVGLSPESGNTCGDVRDNAARKLKEIEGRMRQLKSVQAVLKRLISACPGSGPLKDCSILEALKEE